MPGCCHLRPRPPHTVARRHGARKLQGVHARARRWSTCLVRVLARVLRCLCARARWGWREAGPSGVATMQPAHVHGHMLTRMRTHMHGRMLTRTHARTHALVHGRMLTRTHMHGTARHGTLVCSLVCSHACMDPRTLAHTHAQMQGLACSADYGGLTADSLGLMIWRAPHFQISLPAARPHHQCQVRS